MYRLFLQRGSETLHLDGTDPVYRFVGAKITPAGGDAAVTREEIPFAIEGTPGAIEAALEALGRLLARAPEGYDAHPGAEPVYLVCQAWEGGAEWRSQVREGWAQALPPGAGLRARGSFGGRILLGRENAWEGPQEQAALSNGNGEATSDPLTVFNASDGASVGGEVRHNWVEVLPLAVSGDLPARARFEITNLGAEPLDDVWIGHNAADPTGWVQTFEAEDAAGVATVPDASCSGGGRAAVDLPSGVPTDLLTWALTPAVLEGGRGQPAHALVRFALPGWEPNTRFRLALRHAGAAVWESGWAQPGGDRALQIRDLFRVRLPGLAPAAALDLVLSAEQSSGVTRTIHVDFLALVAAERWRVISCAGEPGVPPGGRVVDDGIAGVLWCEPEAGAGRVALPVGRGDPPALVPRRGQRLYFFSHTVWANSAPVDHRLGVRVFFRPRRRCL